MYTSFGNRKARKLFFIQRKHVMTPGCRASCFSMMKDKTFPLFKHNIGRITLFYLHISIDIHTFRLAKPIK